MGFDLYINLKLMMCPKTGKPYYFDTNFEKVYGLEDFTIPDHLRPYLMGRGRQFHAYIESHEQSEVDVDTFLECYPSWDDVKDHALYQSHMDWEKEDHEKFKELLEYLQFLRYPFSVSWSY